MRSLLMLPAATLERLPLAFRITLPIIPLTFRFFSSVPAPLRVMVVLARSPLTLKVPIDGAEMLEVVLLTPSQPGTLMLLIALPEAIDSPVTGVALLMFTEPPAGMVIVPPLAP